LRYHRWRKKPDVRAWQQAERRRRPAALQSGEIDVAFVPPPIIDGEGLALDLLVDEPMMIVLPEWHPHAGDPSMPLAALAPDTLILFPRTIGPGLHDAIIASCQRAGFSPKLGQEARKPCRSSIWWRRGSACRSCRDRSNRSASKVQFI
jgi:DNA-binding transcriptional LysR family regulator